MSKEIYIDRVLQEQHLKEVKEQLRNLFDSCCSDDNEIEQDIMEQKMLLQCFLDDRKSLEELNASRDHRLRYPFLYSPRSSYEPRRRNSKNEARSTATVEKFDAAAPTAVDGADATVHEAEGQTSPETKENSKFAQSNQSNLEAADADLVAVPMSKEQQISTVFNIESLDAASLRGPKYGSYSSGPSLEVTATQVSKISQPNLRNHIVWHRHTETPFDISYSRFILKTPVLHLLQGGHLVFVASRSGSRTAHYSVKIIKRGFYSHANQMKAQKHRSSMEQIQMAAISKDEFLVLKKLAHPCVANLLYFCENEFQYYYFFPHYIYANLSGALSLFNRLGANPCVYIICCMINAVEYLYRNFIIHRDISSKSVLFTTEGRPVLFNFDYATFYGSLFSPDAKPNYLPDLSTRAPEVISPLMHYESEMYPNSDIWGLGVLLGELLMGNKVMMRALKRKLDLHWVFSVRESDGDASTQSYPSVPKDLLELVRSCLRKQCQDRPNIHSLMLNGVFSQYGVPSIQMVIRQKAPIERLFNGL